MDNSGGTAAIVLAAGSGKRMGAEEKKQYMMIHGKPMLYYSLSTMERSFIDEVILVVAKGEVPYCRKEIVEKYGFTKVRAVVEGGEERYHSVYHGIEELGPCEYVFIQDAARPMLTTDILERALDQVIQSKACVVGMPVKDTMVITGQGKRIQETPDRDCVWMAQTPQVFEYKLLRQAYGELMKAEDELTQTGMRITDDAMVVRKMTGHPVELIEGSYNNIKVTTLEDLLLAELFLDSEFIKN